MTTERMIKAVEAVADKHKNDFVHTFQTNITSMCRDIIPKLELLAIYEAIGSVAECQKAAEKQKAEKPKIWINDDGINVIKDMYDCPSCKESYVIGKHEYKYCPNCGKAFDCSEIMQLKETEGII